MPAFQVTPDILAAFAGVVLSLLFSYIPKLNTGFAALTGEVKRLIMLALLLAVSVVVFLLGCYAIVGTGLTCDRAGAIQLAWMFILAVIANQSAYNISPQTQGVKVSKFIANAPAPQSMVPVMVPTQGADNVTVSAPVTTYSPGASGMNESHTSTPPQQ